MINNEILDEIRKVRDEHAEECGYDVHRAFDQLRAETERLKDEGWQVVDRSAHRSVVREDGGEGSGEKSERLKS